MGAPWKFGDEPNLVLTSIFRGELLVLEGGYFGNYFVFMATKVGPVTIKAV